MSLNKKALKEKLLRQYSDQLDEMLNELDQAERLHLTEIENAALKARHQVSQAITQELSEHESQGVDVDVCCPECQQGARYKGKKRKWIKTRSGEIQIERAYWYCPRCRAGFFPTG